jgi:hypothetical protein
LDNAKEIVNERILSSLGVNDTASCFALDGAPQDSRSTVFGSANRPPKLDGPDPQKMLKLVKGKGDLREPQVSDEDSFKVLQEVQTKQPGADAQRGEWQNKVTSLSRPAIDGSNYVAALEGIVRQMDHHKRDASRDVWLFIVGDLKNEPRPDHIIHADPDAFDDFKEIWLVYPYNSNDPSWPATERFWEDYLAGIRHEKLTFASALGQEFLLKPNPASGLETIPGENFWRVFMPYLIAASVVCVLGVVGVYLLIRRGRRFPSPFLPA